MLRDMSLSGGIYRRKVVSEREKIEEVDEGKTRVSDKNVLPPSKYSKLFSGITTFHFNDVVKLLHKPTCPSSLGVVRALFGFMMMIDVPDERGLANIDLRFGDPLRCHFPLFDWLSPLPLEYMGFLYFVMWLGSLGICLGYKFKLSCIMFIIPYWYIYLLDKSFWNNHSYLYGLVSILFAFTSANHSFSLDAQLSPSIKNRNIPQWNYAIIRFQFFLLYFYAGIKKFDPDWIGGYSMTRLGSHWVFEPFRLVLNNDQIDFWIIHIFGFFFDLTVGFFFLIDKTRPIAIVFSTAFHVMNSCMFHIGQFPYVCLVTTPIFCKYDWPEQLLTICGKNSNILQKSSIMNSECVKEERVTWKQKMECFVMGIYVTAQLFLPFSHFLTQGYNNWTNGLYGYSWDMMVQNWNSNLIVVKVVDNESREEFFIDPEAWVGNTRYSKHGDMLIQYAKCLKRNLNSPWLSNGKDIRGRSFDNISIHIDVWCSLNGRFQQRMFTPLQDLLTAEWNPFDRISWLMPLLSDLSSWRHDMYELQKMVHSWSNYSEVLFVADFPGFHLENYIGTEFTNVTVTVLQGVVILEQETVPLNTTEDFVFVNVTLTKGESSNIKEGHFHKIYTVSDEPSCYMYIYNNYSLGKLGSETGETINLSVLVVRDFLLENLSIRLENFINSLLRLRDCFKKLLFNVPVPVRNNVDQ
ncbi:hypothetical protein RUM44_007948 [Polyplax serrata]|uniref:HTTM-like domain-containing protein n=1 Tax=Polyplax serrata TaxID=468196 RepID=A0ABR1BAY5_POLSC